jgi:hypothetical protein
VLTRLELEKKAHEALEPYAKELGLLLHAWNHLQLRLLLLFLKVCVDREGEEMSRDILTSVWHSIPNDRFQRNMLRNAARTRFGRHANHMEEIGIDIAPIRQHEKAQLDQILWILDKADGLGRARDDSAHCPTVVHISEHPPFELTPFDSFGNPIAEQLSGKNLVELFALYRARIAVVTEHATAMDYYLSGHGSLPQTPAWPNPPPSSEHKA